MDSPSFTGGLTYPARFNQLMATDRIEEDGKVYFIPGFGTVRLVIDDGGIYRNVRDIHDEMGLPPFNASDDKKWKI